MTRALLAALSLLACPAAAWELGEGGGASERAAELEKRWRPYSKTMVDLDIVKRSVQEGEPDWVTREKEKMTPPERPFGRVHGFTLRQKDVRFLLVGRHGPFKESRDQRELLKALKAAEGAAAATLAEAIERGEAGLELGSSAPGRERLRVPSSDGSAPKKVTWRYLDFYREGGKEPQLYILLLADAPRADLPAAEEP